MERRRVKILKRENDEGSVKLKQRLVGEIKKQKERRKVQENVIESMD